MSPAITLLVLVGFVGAITVALACSGVTSFEPTQLGDLMKVSFEMPSEVRSLQAVPMKLTVKHTGDIPLNVSGGVNNHDYVVTREDGTVIWQWTRHGGGASTLESI